LPGKREKTIIQKIGIKTGKTFSCILKDHVYILISFHRKNGVGQKYGTGDMPAGPATEQSANNGLYNGRRE
jgi:hypothetical protein